MRYTRYLTVLDEPSLWLLSRNQSSEAYRFLWLRTFHQPVVIRVAVNSDGTSRLTMKVTNGTGGYDPGRLVKSEIYALTRATTDLFLKSLEDNRLWQLASVDRSLIGADGAAWVIEAVKDGKYHVVDRWSPNDGPIRVIGSVMLYRLAKLKIPGPIY